MAEQTNLSTYFQSSRFIYQVNQYEQGIVFTFGKLSKVTEPGLHFIIPGIQQLKKVDLRLKTVDVPDQEVLTKDNISVRVNAVVNFKVFDAAKSVIEVEDFVYTTEQLAQTTIKNVVGEYTLDQLLQDRTGVAKRVKDIADHASHPFGVLIDSAEFKDIILSESLKQTIAKAAEAEREKKAIVLISEGEVTAAENMAKAAKILNASPGAMQLRTLSTISDLGASASNNTVWMVPTTVVDGLAQLGRLAQQN